MEKKPEESRQLKDGHRRKKGQKKESKQAMELKKKVLSCPLPFPTGIDRCSPKVLILQGP